MYATIEDVRPNGKGVFTVQTLHAHGDQVEEHSAYARVVKRWVIARRLPVQDVLDVIAVFVYDIDGDLHDTIRCVLWTQCLRVAFENERDLVVLPRGRWHSCRSLR